MTNIMPLSNQVSSVIERTDVEVALVAARNLVIGSRASTESTPPSTVGGQRVKLPDISVTILLFTYGRNYTDYVTIHFIFFFPQFSIVRLRFLPVIPSFSYFILIPSCVPSIC